MPGILCEHCTAVCCRYLALPIDTPKTRSDFDDIRWYLLHEGVSVFVEDGDWYINVVTNCRHLQPDHRCGIYHTRPRICREYTTENCDYHSGDYGWQEHFTCPEHLDEYVKRRKQRKIPAPAKKGRHVHSGLRAHLANRRKKRRANASRPPLLPNSDIRGVPLPLLQLG